MFKKRHDPELQEIISDLIRQGVNLAMEVERLKRKIREHIDKVDEIEGKIND